MESETSLGMEAPGGQPSSIGQAKMRGHDGRGPRNQSLEDLAPPFFTSSAQRGMSRGVRQWPQRGGADRPNPTPLPSPLAHPPCRTKIQWECDGCGYFSRARSRATPASKKAAASRRVPRAAGPGLGPPRAHPPFAPPPQGPCHRRRAHGPRFPAHSDDWPLRRRATAPPPGLGCRPDDHMDGKPEAGTEVAGRGSARCACCGCHRRPRGPPGLAWTLPTVCAL